MSDEKIKAQEILYKIQQEVHAPKGQFNSFGKYNYRSAEDILEAVKPMLPEGWVITISEHAMELAGTIVITSTAKLSNGKDYVSTSAHAGVDINRKGMDIAQSFGASSSYAKKYALGNLLLLDDTKDPDATNDHGKGSTPAEKKSTTGKVISDAQAKRLFAISKSVKMPTDILQQTINDFGFFKSTDITTERYDDIVGMVENFKGGAE